MTNEFILEYSTYIYGIARNFDYYKNKEDLYQAGCIGLLQAYQHYDKRENVKFTTYAYPYILGEMCKLVREDKNIKIGRNMIRLKNQVERVNNYLNQKYSRQPTTLEIAKFMEIKESDVIEALKTNGVTQSIDEPINQEGKDMSLYDIISDRNVNIETLVSLKEALNTLDEQDRKILMYSIEQNMSQQEIASILNTNQVQVSRTLTKIKTNLKNKIAA